MLGCRVYSVCPDRNALVWSGTDLVTTRALVAEVLYVFSFSLWSRAATSGACEVARHALGLEYSGGAAYPQYCFRLWFGFCQDVFNLLPDLSSSELVEAFAIQTNDMMLGLYLGEECESSLAQATMSGTRSLANSAGASPDRTAGPAPVL